ncbi:hypothetical protein [Spirosoma koreense]
MEAESEVVRRLAYSWFRGDLPPGRLAYTDFVNTIAGLNLVTDDPNRTTAIFNAVMQQAKTLGRSSEWVQTELTFETKVEAVGERAKWLRLDIAAQDASDAALDLYNERITRFVEPES